MGKSVFSAVSSSLIRYLADEKVGDADVEKILSAGVNAPSAMNTQAWHFTAVTDEETQKKLADAMSNMKPPAMKDGAAKIMPSGRAGRHDSFFLRALRKIFLQNCSETENVPLFCEKHLLFFSFLYNYK